MIERQQILEAVGTPSPLQNTPVKLTPSEMFINLLSDKYGPVMDIGELAEVLHIKKDSIYAQIARGAMLLPHMRHGRKYLFPTREVALELAETMR